ncbi:fused MFS/spermidine synthase [candidate division KSB1 bacterium]|nr:fused MFS/spermidine synthase [candidate division KSB1 bacterium]
MAKNNYTYFIMAISGVVIPALEIVGIRSLGPYYGISLYLGAVLVTITLAALSTGYLIGGRWADKNPQMEIISYSLIIVGILIILIPLLRNPILYVIEPLGIQLTLFIGASLLLFPSFMLIGAIELFVIKVVINNSPSIGKSIGGLLATLTLASIIGVLVTLFLLIPYLGIEKSAISLGLLLCAIGIIPLLFKKVLSMKLSILILLIVSSVAGLTWHSTINAETPDKLVFKMQSPDSEISIVDQDIQRMLIVNGNLQATINKETLDSMHPHVVVMNTIQYCFRRPGKGLLIGLGAGSISKNFTAAGWRMDAVERDPGIVKVAQRYFDVQPGDCRMHVVNGREFLMNTNDKYNLIVINDLGCSPFASQLITSEACDLISARLDSNGVLAINVLTNGWHSKIVRHMAATLGRHFTNVKALPLHEPPTILGNVILLAANRELTFPEEWLGNPKDYVDIDPYEHWVALQQNHAWDNQFMPDTSEVAVIADDLNRSDIWLESINYQAWDKLHAYFTEKGLSW